MGEVVRFVSKAERERLRLIREARAMYDSVFPPSPSINAQADKHQRLNGQRNLMFITAVKSAVIDVARLDGLCPFSKR